MLCTIQDERLRRRGLSRAMATLATRSARDVARLSITVNGRGSSRPCLCIQGLLPGEVADIVLLQEAFGVETMADLCKGIAGIFAGLLQHDFGTAWMVFHPPRDVIDLSIDDQPEVSGARMLSDLVPGIGAIHRCGPPSWFQYHDVAVCGVDSASRCASAAVLALFDQDTMLGNARCIRPSLPRPRCDCCHADPPLQWEVVHTIAKG